MWGGCPINGCDRPPSWTEAHHIDQWERDHGKTFEFHRYDDAGHAFFSVDRPAYRVAAALDGWQRIRTFLVRHLAAEG